MKTGQAALFSLVAIGFTLICILGVNWLGMAGAFLTLLTPVGAAYLGLRFGMRSAIIVVVTTALLLLELANVYTLAAYLGLYGCSSLLFPYLLRKRIAWDRAAAVSIGAALAVTLSMLLLTTAMADINLQQLIAQGVDSEFEQAMQIYRASGLEGAQLKELEGYAREVAQFCQAHFVGLAVAMIMVLHLICLLVLQRFRGRHYEISGSQFERWRLPQHLIWILIAAGFSCFAPLDILQSTGRNLILVLAPVYFLQGMAVVVSLLQRQPYPPFIKGVIYALLVLLNPLPIVVAIVGVFDLWIDFRRPRQKLL